MIRDILFGHFDKVLLAFLIVLFAFLLLHMDHDASDDRAVQPIETMLAGFGGALTIIVTKDAKKSGK